ncbi:cyclin mcs2 [Annulohypoxylon maeteangense]|uniref:cyclin mcs2 n=1 Tax=Annulohypoxylon maeteangense TaxID=1927788 RepID=UPI00200814CC|nr:cyclin mcs2 [Annulohypoxylon maeteangense]KAI0884031.1 cyclin mcs2 [Annulohypoxylon maeteangense]
MATEDARYRQSSQYRLWSFSQPHLATLREKTNALARSHISNRLRASNPSTPAESLPEFMTPSEEYKILNHFTVELLRAASFCNLPTDIQATAAIFLRRFYLTNSVMTYPPQELMKTCLFFGCKAEGYFIRVQKIADTFPNTTSEMILAAEYVLCQGIRFAFDVKHPFRALEGAIMELRRLGAFDEDRVNKAHEKTRAILKFSPLVTDVYYHYTPSQIMYAALAMVDGELVERMLTEAFTDQSDEIKEKILGVIQSCKAMLEEEPPEKMTSYWEDKEIVKGVKVLRRKLAKCRDPDRVDLVALQKVRRAHASQKPKAKGSANTDENVFGNAINDERESKRRKVAANGDDLFGPPL